MIWLQKVEHLYGNGVLGGLSLKRMNERACGHKVRIWRRMGRGEKNN